MCLLRLRASESAKSDSESESAESDSAESAAAEHWQPEAGRAAGPPQARWGSRSDSRQRRQLASGGSGQ